MTFSVPPLNCATARCTNTPKHALMFVPFFMRPMRSERLALQSELADLEAEMAADLNVKSLKELGYAL